MSFHRYHPPNAPLPPPPKGAFGAIGAGGVITAQNVVKLTGSSPRTSVLDGMFSYSPPALPRGIQPEYSKVDLWTDLLSLPTSTKGDQFSLTDTLSIPTIGNKENWMIQDVPGLIPMNFMNVDSFGDSLLETYLDDDAFTFDDSASFIQQQSISDLASPTDSVNITAPNIQQSDMFLFDDSQTNIQLMNFIEIESFGDGFAEAYVNSDIYTFDDSMSGIVSLPSVDTVSISDVVKIVGATANGVYVCMEGFFMDDSQAHPKLISFVDIESFTDSDKLVSFAGSETVVPSDSFVQLKP